MPGLRHHGRAAQLPWTSIGRERQRAARDRAEPQDVDAFNARVVEAMQRGGMAYVTATRWDGRGRMRAAFDNWATTTPDVLALQTALERALQADVG